MAVTTLENGIRLVSLRAPGPVARCALVIGAGSRDETETEHGLAHFVEHTVFKGTGKRRAHHILNRLDEVGGELNAYTTKDETAIHASFLKDDLPRAAELIADMAFNSTFPAAELDKEREVIMDEITSYEDTPAELIFDEFEDLAFAGTPLGHNILGTAESVGSFTGDDARRFIGRAHTTDRMCFAYIGPASETQVARVAERYFGKAGATTHGDAQGCGHGIASFDKEASRGTSQAHVVIGCAAPDLHDADRLEMNVISNLLGGPSMNSRLSVALRERHGIAYNVETNYTPYADTGLFTIYFGTDGQNIARSMALVRKEVDSLCQSALTERQFAKVIRQYCNQIIMSADDSESLMLAAGRNAVVYGDSAGAEEMANAVRERVTRESMLRVAQKVLGRGEMSRLIYA